MPWRVTKFSKEIAEHEEDISVAWALHGSCAQHHQDRCELQRRCHHGRHKGCDQPDQDRLLPPSGGATIGPQGDCNLEEEAGT